MPDALPKLRVAGKLIPGRDLNADQVIRADIYPNTGRGNVGTPPQHKKYRTLTKHEPGKMLVHYGLEGLK